MPKKLSTYLGENEFFKNLPISPADRDEFIRLVEDDFLFDFLSSIIQESEEILSINPLLARREILELAAKNIVCNLDAAAASIRLFDPKSFKMLTFGAAGLKDSERSAALPVKESIAGQVVEEGRSIVVPSIMKDKLFKDKKIIAQKGFHSLIAVPLRMSSFVESSDDILGTLQIYYQDDNRHFSRHEIVRAEMLARRVSYVMAKKRILEMKALSDKKEAIADKIFVKLSNREGIKLKDFFNLLIPELEELIQLHSCSLFTLSDDQKTIYQEAHYPTDHSYHEDGYLFTLDHHDYFWTAVHGTKEYVDMEYERIDPSYVLIKNPARSSLTTPGLRKFTEIWQIHSILFLPLQVEGVTRHILCFFATQQKQYFTEDQIELLTFFGKEITKALRLEFLGDMLHDFKNPAVAVAGLSSRSRKLLDSNELNSIRDKLIYYQDVISREAARMQDLALTMTGEGKKEILDLGRLALERFRLNEHVIEESKLVNIHVRPAEIQYGLMVKCSKYGLERVLDNLLHNATKAVPGNGGTLEIQCVKTDKMACLEILNSGEVPQNKIERVKRGFVVGRGLNIVSRFIHQYHGKLEITSENGMSTFMIKLPLCRSSL